MPIYGPHSIETPNADRARLADAVVEAWERNLLPAIPGEGETLRLRGYKEIGEAVAAYRAAFPRKDDDR